MDKKYDLALGRILELTVLLNEDMTRSFARDGMTSSRAPVLWALGQSGPLTQRQLAETLHVSARNITGLVDGLVTTGFVTREPHPTDRRATLVTFTARGAAIAKTWGRQHKELAELLFAGVANFDCFLEGLDEVLTRLKAAL